MDRSRLHDVTTEGQMTPQVGVGVRPGEKAGENEDRDQRQDAWNDTTTVKKRAQRFLRCHLCGGEINTQARCRTAEDGEGSSLQACLHNRLFAIKSVSRYLLIESDCAEMHRRGVIADRRFGFNRCRSARQLRATISSTGADRIRTAATAKV